MASLSIDKNGNAAVYVTLPDGRRRRPVRLGKMGRKEAQRIRGHITELESARLNGYEPGSETRAWLVGITGDLRERLAAVGLAQRHEAAMLGAFLESYFAKRSGNVKHFTLNRMKQSKRHALAYFGENKPMREITEADAEDYRAHLQTKLSEATVRKHCGDFRQWFRYLVRAGVVDRNPFESVPTHTKGNASRQRFISDEDARKVLERLPDPSWRLLFSLARWGGLRVPSEPAALTWADVDWENRRLIVHSPKTAHHEGHESRVLPLFPEIAEPLQEVFDAAPAGQTYVLPFVRERTGTALRKPLMTTIRRAGLTQWPRLWHNLRASRQTELEERFPSHVVCAWLGNNESVARAHYLQVRDSDFERALEAVRNPVRTGSAGDHDAYGEPASERNQTHFSASDTGKIPPAGFEPATYALGKRCSIL